MTQPADPLRIDEQERLLAARPEPPQGVVWRLLRERAQAADAAVAETHRQAGEHKNAFEHFARDVANALHGLHGVTAATAADALPSLTAKLAKALEGSGARFLDPAGEPYEEVEMWADVVGSEQRAGLERAVVAETLQPGLLMADGKLAQRARVYLAVPPAVPERQDGQSERTGQAEQAEQAEQKEQEREGEQE
ncbi:hypothetical protein AA958_30095 [Streptomyces sp. CNQ-509]|uniref:hypothetical protein n=1 Tax=Streptomyces sp. CNQ-509 TaxID=444103 RepID=UPI00062E01EE|nr:hypothetical protein [Streptomyces sp. CNQ-509]AKH85768.1 hypothetical protein AA958_30095 [Streptomyces sp. CNQ-509]